MILLDFSPLKAGGGCQVALNFTSHLDQLGVHQEIIILKPASGPLRELDRLFPKFSYATVNSQSIRSRLAFEYSGFKKLCKEKNIDRVLTMFGPGLPRIEGVKSVVGVAYPIICYDESPFWKYLSPKKYIRQKLLNSVRINRIAKADLVIAETEIMEQRLRRILPVKDFKIVPPFPSDFVGENIHTSNRNSKILVLSGLAPHKNLWRLPEIARLLQKKGVKATFVLSCSKSGFVAHTSAHGWSEDLSDMFDFQGNVPPNQIDRLYKEVDYLLSLSDLESYSNNYVEAWKAGIPMIASDRDFAKSICGESAWYVEPHNTEAAATIIAEALSADANTYADKVQKGKQSLSLLPDQKARSKRLLQIIKEI